MIYLTQFLGVPVLDANGRSLGVLDDFIFVKSQGQDCPVVTALVVRRAEAVRRVAWSEVESLTLVQAVSRLKVRQLRPWNVDHQPVFTGREVLNQKVVDEAQARIGKVTDLALERQGVLLQVCRVEVVGETIWHRLGLMRIKNILVPRLKEHGQRSLVPWQELEWLAGLSDPVFQVRPGSLAQIQPVELAQILRGLPVYLRRDFLFSLDSAEITELFEQFEPEVSLELALQ